MGRPFPVVVLFSVEGEQRQEDEGIGQQRERVAENLTVGSVNGGADRRAGPAARGPG